MFIVEISPSIAVIFVFIVEISPSIAVIFLPILVILFALKETPDVFATIADACAGVIPTLAVFIAVAKLFANKESFILVKLTVDNAPDI